MIVAGARPLLDLDAAARAEPVHDVVRIVAPVPLAGQRDPDVESRWEHLLDGPPEPLFHVGGRRPPDEHPRFIVEAVEGHGMGEAPGHDRVEQGEADRVEVRGGDVPANEGAAARPPALAPPRAGQLRAEALGHPFGLLVGVLLDVATVGGDDDEVRLGAVVVQPLDQLTGISGVLVGQVRIDDLRVQHTLELLLRLEPLPAAETHAHDRVRRLVQQLAHGVERELAVAMDSHLLAEPAVEGRQRSRRRGAVLAVVLEIRPGCRTPS